MEENKLQKKKKQNNKTLKLLGKISTIVIILLLSLISFVGIYVKDKKYHEKCNTRIQIRNRSIWS